MHSFPVEPVSAAQQTRNVERRAIQASQRKALAIPWTTPVFNKHRVTETGCSQELLEAFPCETVLMRQIRIADAPSEESRRIRCMDDPAATWFQNSLCLVGKVEELGFPQVLNDVKCNENVEGSTLSVRQYLEQISPDNLPAKIRLDSADLNRGNIHPS